MFPPKSLHRAQVKVSGQPLVALECVKYFCRLRIDWKCLSMMEKEEDGEESWIGWVLALNPIAEVSTRSWMFGVCKLLRKSQDSELGATSWESQRQWGNGGNQTWKRNAKVVLGCLNRFRLFLEVYAIKLQHLLKRIDINVLNVDRHSS